MHAESVTVRTTPLIDPQGSSFWYRVGFGILAASLLIRALWYPVVVSDYTYFGKPWFDTLQSHSGLTAFAEPFADYAPAYLYLLKLLTHIPLSSLYSEKTLSLSFDVLIAVFAYLILERTSAWSRRKDILFLAAVTFFCLPTVMMNSSLWAQSDALYSAAVMASLLCMLVDAPFLAAIAFGIAVSFKLQAIFFTPILIGYLFRRKATALYALIPPAVFALSILPAAIWGGQLRYWLFIYLSQAKEYPYLSVSAQSIFAFLQPLALSPMTTAIAFWVGVSAAAAAAFASAYLVYKKGASAPYVTVLAALLATLLIPYLLPRMHERYFYLADLFAVLYAFYQPKRWFIPIVIVGTSLMSYMPFLSGQVSFLSWAHVDLRVPAAILLIPICAVLYDAWHILRGNAVQANTQLV